MTVSDKDKEEHFEIAKRFTNIGYRLLATMEQQKYLEECRNPS